MPDSADHETAPGPQSSTSPAERDVPSEQGLLARQDVVPAYIGFFDALGFSRRVLSSFDEALAVYNTVMKFADLGEFVESRPESSFRILSDAIVVASPKLTDVVIAANLLQFASLASANVLLRGGIGYGLHVESLSRGHLFVVSEALVRAVAVEKTVRNPCIALDERIVPPPGAWFPYENNFHRMLLYYEKRWLVNPLTPAWGVSAATRVENLKDEYPEHSDKYDWFLEFHRRIFGAEPLIPLPDEWKEMGGELRDGCPVLNDPKL